MSTVSDSVVDGDERVTRVQFSVRTNRQDRILIRGHLSRKADRETAPGPAQEAEVREFYRTYGQQVGEQVLVALYEQIGMAREPGVAA